MAYIRFIWELIRPIYAVYVLYIGGYMALYMRLYVLYKPYGSSYGRYRLYIGGCMAYIGSIWELIWPI